MFNEIKDVFAEHNIPYVDHLVGFPADGANAMMGINNSLSTLLKSEIPHLFVFKSIYHSFALCASYACRKLPEGIEMLLRDIYKLFQYSSKKSAELKEFQVFCNVKPHKLLYPSQTRWLSLILVVKRVLEQWDSLMLFFMAEVSENKSETETACLIITKMKNIFSSCSLQNNFANVY